MPASTTQPRHLAASLAAPARFRDALLARTVIAALLALLAAVLMMASPARAATIGSLDLSAMRFQITMERLSGQGRVSGLSNGIGFDLDVQAYDAARSSISDDRAYNDMPGTYDNLTLWRNFTITFATPIRAILFAISKTSNAADGPDFGILPADSKDIAVTGTQLLINDNAGALVYMEFNLPVSQITQTDRGRKDAFAMSFFVTAVPVPASGALMAGALGLVALLKRRRLLRAG